MTTADNKWIECLGADLLAAQQRLEAKRAELGYGRVHQPKQVTDAIPSQPAAPKPAKPLIIQVQQQKNSISPANDVVIFSGEGERKMIGNDETAQMSLFVADVLSWHPKGERHTMEHPFYSLQKKPDTKDRHYISSDGKVEVLIRPTSAGLPTIWDKDLLIYLCTLIREGMNSGTISPDRNVPVRIDAYNYFEATQKGGGGRQYTEMIKTLERLRGTSIKTTIKTNDKTYIHGFGLVDRYDVAVETKSGKIAAVDVMICDWLWGAVKNAQQEMLTIHRDYFNITSGLDRRLYELARKHCGHQPHWKVSMKVLHMKSGSTGSLREFRRAVHERQTDLGNLPEYRIQIDKETDSLTFYSRTARRAIDAIKKIKGG